MKIIHLAFHLILVCVISNKILASNQTDHKILKATERLENLAKAFQHSEKGIEGVLNELKGLEHTTPTPKEEDDKTNFVSGSSESGGPIICICNNKFVAHPQPTLIGTSALNETDSTGRPLVVLMKDKLSQCGNKKSALNYSVPTAQKDPRDPKRYLAKNYTAIVWGSNALLGAKKTPAFDDLLCYIALEG